MPVRRSSTERVTIVDVARESGFSPSTVSIVLNEAPLSRYVAATTKAHIRKTAERLGYHPNAFARSLRSRRSATIGVLIFDISDPFCTLILRGIETSLHATTYLPLIMDAQNQTKKLEAYLGMLMERRVEGLIVVANWTFEEGGLLAQMRSRNLPTVVVGRDLSADGIPSVIVDNHQGGYLAVEHLYRLGHREIAVIRGPAKLSDSDRRWDGITRFTTEHKVKILKRNVRQLTGSLDPTSGFEGGLALTEDLLHTRNFSAVIAFDDLTALGAIRALVESGARVPRDCSVVGFDDIPAACLVTPALTTVQQPMEEMGALATKRVLATLADDSGQPPSGGLVQMLAPRLIARSSSTIKT